MKKGAKKKAEKRCARRAAAAEPWACEVEYRIKKGLASFARVAVIRGGPRAVRDLLSKRMDVQVLAVYQLSYSQWVNRRGTAVNSTNAMEVLLSLAKDFERMFPGELVDTPDGPVEVKKAIAHFLRKTEVKRLCLEDKKLIKQGRLPKWLA